MSNIKRLIDNDGNEFYPRTVKAAISDLNAPDMTVTNVDPGAGQPLESGKIIAVVGNGGAISNSDILEGTITPDKLNKQAFVDLIYPVGSVYISTTLATATQVQNVLGGTWVAWGAGRVPVGVDASQTEFNSVGKTGGEKTHTLVQGELPKITSQPNANLVCHQAADQADGALTYKFRGHAGAAGGNSFPYGQIKLSIGNDQAHNNLQPYITCYMYKRTA